MVKGREIKEYRKKNKMTQKQLSLITGIPVSILSRIENEKRKIHAEEAEKIMKAFPEAPTAVDEGSIAAIRNVLIYTDGSCASNPGGPGGVGILIIDQETGEFKEISKGYTATTNNRMEVMAAIIALESLDAGARVKLVSDSLYLVNTMNGIWARKKNKDLWEKLDSVSEHKDVTYHWVKGHNGDPHNERCDELAAAGARAALKDTDTGYNPQKPDHVSKTGSGGAMGIQLSLPDVTIPRLKRFVNSKCLESMKKFRSSRKKFKDYAQLRTGGCDGWSHTAYMELCQMAGSDVCDSLRVYFDELQIASCLRWYGRGLSLEDSARKVLVDQEVLDNCRFR